MRLRAERRKIPARGMHKSSLARMESLVAEFLAGQRGVPLGVLDVGSLDVNGSYRVLFSDPNWRYTGLDLAEGPGVDLVVEQPYRWRGVRSASFDVVISGQSFEHIEFPWVTMLEVERVLRPGGLCFLVVPSTGPEHRYPVDCWRFYRDGVVALARWAGFAVERAETHTGDEGWGDGSDQWHDTVLVARKSPRSSLPGRLWRATVRLVLRAQARRRAL
jgi:SAM-dependent methyltransferase